MKPIKFQSYLDEPFPFKNLSVVTKTVEKNKISN